MKAFQLFRALLKTARRASDNRAGLMTAICLTTVFLVPAVADTTEEERVNMRVSEEGVLLLRDQPYRGIGVNYFNAFQRRLMNPEDTSYREGFKALARYEIPFIRFMAGGFWPYEWELYKNDRDAYFALMDDMIHAAAEAGLGLIPSVFWWYPCVPDLVGEPVNAWGRPDSKTHAFMRQYVEELVGRYRNHPAIWVWELGNEYNLASDLPNAMDHLPWVRTDWGTPASRGKDDVLTGEALIVAMTAFGNTVRRLDPIRPITSGHAILRPSAFHQRKELSWKRDTRDEHIRELLLMHPDPMDMLSTHIYPEALTGRYFDRDEVSYADLLEAAMDAARQSGKPLFVGEFGAPEGDDPEQSADARSQFGQLLRAILDSGAPLSALWVFDYPPQDGEWNVTGNNHLAYRLEMIRDANRALGQPGEKTE